MIRPRPVPISWLYERFVPIRWETVDDPIRSLMVELNRVGYVTLCSCCGFRYQGQRGKSHATGPYVSCDGGQVDPKVRRGLYRVVRATRWWHLEWPSWFVPPGRIVVFRAWDPPDQAKPLRARQARAAIRELEDACRAL